MKELIFNTDGTIDPAQLEGMPQEFIDRVTSPEFIAQARQNIRQQMRKDQATRDPKKEPVRFIPNQAMRGGILRRADNRRPDGLSGRQRVRLRRLQRRFDKIRSGGAQS